MFLVFDTETTGKAFFGLPPGHASQPRIVQLGAILYDENQRVTSEVNLLVRPDGWTVPPDAEAIHGISTERAMRYGVQIGGVLRLFQALCDRADKIVAHNLDFDRFMIASELGRAGQGGAIDAFNARSGFCTMKESTDILKIPGHRGYKWPNLQEAHRHFTGDGFDGAHDAMADVRACARVYFAMRGKPNPEAK